MSNKFLISVVGATAIGKTALSIRLAQYFNTQIVSCDSRQFYKELSIGTAVPSNEELAMVPHHFIQNRSIHEAYNVGQFENDAIKKLDELHQRFDMVILVGGSGLYGKALLEGLDTFPEIESKVRENLITSFNKSGIDGLLTRLKALDPETYHTIDHGNHQRVIRALEVSIGTGQPYASFLNKNRANRPFKSIKIGLSADRETIYHRINQRVDQMIEMGLVNEAKKLHPYKELNALQTVGYKELFNYFDGTLGLDQAIAEIKKNTRRFAKRQLTWFRKDLDIQWFDYQSNVQQIIKYIESKLTT